MGCGDVGKIKFLPRSKSCIQIALPYRVEEYLAAVALQLDGEVRGILCTEILDGKVDVGICSHHMAGHRNARRCDVRTIGNNADILYIRFITLSRDNHLVSVNIGDWIECEGCKAIGIGKSGTDKCAVQLGEANVGIRHCRHVQTAATCR